MNPSSTGAVIGPLLLPPLSMSQRLRDSENRSLPQFGSQDSTLSAMDFKKRQFAALSKPDVQIVLDIAQTTFSTLDKITGHVTISVKHPTPFSNIEISLTGVTKTFISDPSRSGASIRGSETEAVHRFLKLVQPTSMATELPQSRILQPGVLYQLPFVFVIPQRLLPRVCAHTVVSSSVRDAHIELPPSLGDKADRMDGFAPQYVKISYSINVKVSKDKDGNKKTTIADPTRKIRIRPATEEHPPLDTDDSSEYCMRQTKTIRKGLLKGRLGALVMEATQPSSFQLPAIGSGAESNCSTYLRLRFRFDPASPTTSPPRLSSLSTKLRVATHFATTARSQFARTAKLGWQDMTADSSMETVSLSNLAVGDNVHWDVHKPQSQRTVSALSMASVESVMSTNSTLKASDEYKEGVFYTSSILVPLTLPTNGRKSFVPTFHSCLVSRTYALHVSLGLDKGTTRISPLALKVPVQVSSALSVAGQERQRLESMAQQAIRDIDAAFEPRMVGPDFVQVERTTTQNSFMELPPGYEVINSNGFTAMRSPTMMT